MFGLFFDSNKPHITMDKKNRIYLPLIIAAAIVCGIFLGYKMQSRNNAASQKTLHFFKDDKLSLIFDLIEKNYVDTIKKDDLIEKMIPQLLEQLDPHSTYIEAKDLQGISDEMRGNFSGIGVQFVMQNDTLLILEVISGGPSFKLGIQPGDQIINVNGETIAGIKMPSDSIVPKLKGRKGTHVNVSIKREGISDLIEFDIERGEIPIFSIDVAYMINDSIGLVKVNKFAETTYREFREAIEDLRSQGAKKLIVDLRGNSGGYLQAVFQMVDEFLPADKMIVYTEGKSRPREEYLSSSNSRFGDMDIAVLIDEFTASASEIFAGAIQDNDRGIIVGRRSFGKGLVQEQIPFMDGSAIRLTVARFYTPSGRSIQKSYANGMDEYRSELEMRMIHDEFLHPDSIHFADSLKYFTVSGRAVYGGGGIMPDVFVPADTTGISTFFRNIVTKNSIYSFALDYSNKHRKSLSAYDTPKKLTTALDELNVFDQFLTHVKGQGITYTQSDLSISKSLIKTQLYAYISRNILGDHGLYPIIFEEDKTVLKAIEELEKGWNPSAATVTREN